MNPGRAIDLSVDLFVRVSQIIVLDYEAFLAYADYV